MVKWPKNVRSLKGNWVKNETHNIEMIMYDGMRVVALRSECTNRGLDSNGKVDVFRARLRDNDA